MTTEKLSERLTKRLTQHRELERDVWESYIEDSDKQLITDGVALEAEVKALREKAEKWDILEKTSKGILTDNYYKMKIKAEVAEAEVKALGEQLEVTARLGGEQARGAIYLNHQLIKAESRLAEAEKDSKEWEKQYRKLRESIMNIVFPPQTELSRSIDNFKPEEEKALGVGGDEKL